MGERIWWCERHEEHVTWENQEAHRVCSFQGLVTCWDVVPSD